MGDEGRRAAGDLSRGGAPSVAGRRPRRLLWNRGAGQWAAAAAAQRVRRRLLGLVDRRIRRKLLLFPPFRDLDWKGPRPASRRGGARESRSSRLCSPSLKSYPVVPSRARRMPRSTGSARQRPRDAAARPRAAPPRRGPLPPAAAARPSSRLLPHTASRRRHTGPTSCSAASYTSHRRGASGPGRAGRPRSRRPGRRSGPRRWFPPRSWRTRRRASRRSWSCPGAR